MFQLLLIIDKDLEKEKEEDPKNILLPIPITQQWGKKEEDRGYIMPGRGNKTFGYKIKYIDPLPGFKYKRLLYEIKPGVWIPRGQVPEIKLQKKRRNNRPEVKLQSKKQWNNYYAKHKETILKKGRTRKNNNKDKYWMINNRYNNSEYGFIMNLYGGALKEYKKGRRGEKVPLEFTRETWWQHWLKQKAKYGMKCPYSKVLMTTIRGRGRGTSGGKKIATNISRDQLWPGRGYTPINLVFCASRFNLQEKKCITPDGCEAVADLYNERMDEWANQMILKEEMNRIDISAPENIKYYRKELRKFKRSVSEKEYKRYLDLTYQQAILKRNV
jgi:hypothetical protein